MSLLARLALACYLAIAFVPQALARDVVTPPPVQALVPFTSDEGLARFARAVGKIDFPAPANQFAPQAAAAPRPAGCGSNSFASAAKSIFPTARAKPARPDRKSTRLN